MNIEVFKLDEYFDEMFNYKNEMKKTVFQVVDIYESSYRVDRLRKVVKNNNRNLLLKYFGYKSVSKDIQEKYERCISRIYYSTYYIQQDIMKE